MKSLPIIAAALVVALIAVMTIPISHAEKDKRKGSKGSKGSRKKDDKKALKKCGGVYYCIWEPKSDYYSFGSFTPHDSFSDTALELKIPRRGRGLTDSRLDSRHLEMSGSPSEEWMPLKTRFKKPKVTQGGKMIKYEGSATLKRTEFDPPFSHDWVNGKFTARVSHKRNKCEIKRGNLQLFDYGDPTDLSDFYKYSGPIHGQ